MGTRLGRMGPAAGVLLALAALAPRADAQVTFIDDFSVAQLPATTVTGSMLFGQRALVGFPAGARIADGLLQVDFGSAAIRYGSTLAAAPAYDFIAVQSFSVRWNAPGGLPSLFLTAWSGSDARATLQLPPQAAAAGLQVLEIPAVQLWTADVTAGFTPQAITQLTLSMSDASTTSGPLTIDAWWVTGTVASVPEAPTMVLLMLGAAALGARRLAARPRPF